MAGLRAVGRTMLLVGGAGPAPLGIDIAMMIMEQAAARGLGTHIISREPDIEYTRAVCDMAAAVSVVDFEDVDASVAWALEQRRGGRRFDVVFATREMAVVTAAEIAAALGVPGNPPEVVRLVRTKDLCRRRLAAAGLRQPRVVLCRDGQEAERARDSIAGPAVVKPRDGAGSEGVTLVTGPDGMAAALARLPDDHPFLVEEFVEGAEYSVEGVFRGGRPEILAITAKEKLPTPGFVELGHLLPAPLPANDRDRIMRTVCTALGAAGLRSGLFHVELWLTPDDVVMGEVHPRLGGDYIHRLLAHAIDGLEMFGEVFDDVLGDPPDVTRRCARAGAVRYLVPPPGRLEKVAGWEEAVAHPRVLASELDVAPGTEIRPCLSSDDRAGAIAVGADDAAEAGRLARVLTESVSFTVGAAAGQARGRPRAGQ